MAVPGTVFAGKFARVDEIMLVSIATGGGGISPTVTVKAAISLGRPVTSVHQRSGVKI